VVFFRGGYRGSFGLARNEAEKKLGGTVVSKENYIDLRKTKRTEGGMDEG